MVVGTADEENGGEEATGRVGGRCRCRAGRRCLCRCGAQFVGGPCHTIWGWPDVASCRLRAIQLFRNEELCSPLFSSYAKVDYKMGCADVLYKNETLIWPAVQAAQAADATIIIVGLNKLVEAESLDRENLKLLGYQNQFMSDEGPDRAEPSTPGSDANPNSSSGSGATVTAPVLTIVISKPEDEKDSAVAAGKTLVCSHVSGSR